MVARITLLAGALMLVTTGAALADGEPYASPIKDKCNEEILKDADWYKQLATLFADQLFFDPRTGVSARPEVELPEHEPGYTSPMRDQCAAELKKDSTWMAELRAHYDGRLSYDFQTRNSRSFTRNKQHVIGAYAAILVILVGFVVTLLLRQRKLQDEIDRLREDVDRAAND